MDMVVLSIGWAMDGSHDGNPVTGDQHFCQTTDAKKALLVCPFMRERHHQLAGNSGVLPSLCPFGFVPQGADIVHTHFKTGNTEQLGADVTSLRAVVVYLA